MRIGIDARSVHPAKGGIGNYALNLIRSLAGIDRKNEYILFVTHAKGNLKLTNAPNFTEVSYDTAMIDARWEQFELPNELNKFKIDLYHSPMFALPATKVCRYIATIHDAVFHYRPELVERWLREYLEKWTSVSSRIADGIITVSHYSKDAIAAAYEVDPETIRVIYNGVSPRFTPNGNREEQNRFKYRYHLPVHYILYVGSIEPKKNVTTLLKAFKLLISDASLKHHLVLAGGQGGLKMDIYARIAQLGIQDRVTVTGYVSDSDLGELYRSASVFVYPSLYEGFGLPPLEAFASGVPVITSNATSLPETVGDAALTFDPADYEQLAACMRDLLQSEQTRMHLIRKGLERVRKFSWMRTARETLEFYEEIAKRPTSVHTKPSQIPYGGYSNG